MTATIYRDGIRAAYEGELIGETLYRELAGCCADGGHRAKLDAIAEVERLTHGRLKPIALRLGICPVEADWRAVVERRASELASLPWREFIDKALRDWPPYIARFAALQPLAPAGDEVPVQQLVDHEVVLVQFAHLEHSNSGSDASLRALQAYLGIQS